MLTSAHRVYFAFFAAFLLTQTTLTAGLVPGTSDVKAFFADGSFVQATAVHGVFTGNDSQDGGEPLLSLLNDGGTAEFKDPNGSKYNIQISPTGMFSTSSTFPSTFVDLVDGTPVVLSDGDNWSFAGKTEAGMNGGPFEAFANTTDGLLTLITPQNGNLIVSFKAANFYAVYAFENVAGVVAFSFSTFDIDKNADPDKTKIQNPGLSHVSLYTAPGTEPDGPDDQAIPTPEPASLALFGFGAAGLAGFVRRRRQRFAKTN